MPTPRALELPGRNPLAFPVSRAPGFDPTHPAAAGMNGVGFSAIPAQGGTFINLVVPEIATGTGTYGVLGSGPGTKQTSGSIYLSLNSYTPATFAAIFQLSSSQTNYGGIVGSSGQALYLNSSSQFDFYSNGDNTLGSLAAQVGVPYFFAGSIKSGKCNLVVVNLNTGQIYTATSSASNPSSTNAAYLGGISSQTLSGSVLAAMGSPGFLSLDQLLAWAADPWAFWYPHQPILLFTASAVTSFSMSIGSGTYALTEENEMLYKASLAKLYDGTYSLTEENLQTLKGSKSTVYVGNYSLTEEQLTLTKASLQKAQTGYYTLTEEQLTETAARKATVQTGYYSLTEEQLALLFGHKATVQTGYYSLTEEQLKLLNAHSQTIQTGYYSVVGENLTLTFSGATGFVMTIGAGTYSLSGENQGQLKKSIAALSTTFYTLTEENLQTLKGSKIGAQAGYYTFTVENEKLLYGREATIQSGSYSLTGEQIKEIAAHFSKLGAGVYSMTGEAVITIAGLRVTIKAAPVLLGADITPKLVGNESPTDLLGTDIVPGLKGQVT